MSFDQITNRVGATARWYANSDLAVDVKILSIKPAYGSFCYCITPVSGLGQKWVKGDKLSFDPSSPIEAVKRCYKCGSPVEGEAAYLSHPDGTHEHIGGCR